MVTTTAAAMIATPITVKSVKAARANPIKKTGYSALLYSTDKRIPKPTAGSSAAEALSACCTFGLKPETTDRTASAPSQRARKVGTKYARKCTALPIQMTTMIVLPRPSAAAASARCTRNEHTVLANSSQKVPSTATGTAATSAACTPSPDAIDSAVPTAAPIATL